MLADKYEKVFIQRTKELVDENYPSFEEKGREVTFLLNCLLGLIVAVSENESREDDKDKYVFKRKNIDDDFLTLVPDKVGFIKNSRDQVDLTDIDLTELNTKVGHKNDLRGKESQLWFIRKIRHAIAHQHIEAINANGMWVGVRLWDTNRLSIKDFEIVFTIEELRRLAIELSAIYLQAKFKVDPKVKTTKLKDK